MQNNRITSHPPVKKSAQEFILEAESRNRINNEKEILKKNLPWNDDKVRADVQKVFTVRLPEEYILKIKYISDHTNKPQQKIIRELIITNIDDMLKNMGL